MGFRITVHSFSLLDFLPPACRTQKLILYYGATRYEVAHPIPQREANNQSVIAVTLSVGLPSRLVTRLRYPAAP